MSGGAASRGDEDRSGEAGGSEPEAGSESERYAGDAAEAPRDGGREGCPPTPASPDPADLGFEPRPMVGWFAPTELARTGVRALLSGLFGQYADQREMQAVLEEAGSFDYSGEDELWLDYVADLGDGFEPTYAVARTLALPELELERDGRRHATRRGRVLVFGGDQVYPSASPTEYRNRTEGPYRAALPCVPEGSGRRAPHLFAIPGNHDWYDGLTSFTRLFGQQRWIGGWRTRQTRSYFALELPHDWWLWGIDVQLESDVDLPQVEYFRRVATEEMEPGSRVILCTAEPSWVYAETKGPEAYRNLRFVEESLIREHGHTLAVGLAGDLHTYARYEAAGEGEEAAGPGAEGGDQRFVSGGGGAYLYPTHDLPDRLELPSGGGPGAYERRAAFPDPDASRRRTWGALLFPLLNRGFAGLLAAIYLWFAWVAESVSTVRAGAAGGGASAGGAATPSTLLETLAEIPFGPAGFGRVVAETWGLLIHSPGSVFVVALLTAGLIAFADAGGEGWRKTADKVALGGVHAAVHLALVLALMWGAVAFNLGVLGIGAVESPAQVLLFAAEMLVLGGLLGGFVFGAYLLLTNRLLGRHSNEVYTCQSIPDYKSFLRLRIDGDGELTIYPVGIPEVPRRWRFRDGARPGEAWFEPEDDGPGGAGGGDGEIAGEDGGGEGRGREQRERAAGEGMAGRVVLVEEPVRIPGRQAGSGGGSGAGDGGSGAGDGRSGAGDGRAEPDASPDAEEAP